MRKRANGSRGALELAGDTNSAKRAGRENENRNIENQSESARADTEAKAQRRRLVN